MSTRTQRHILLLIFLLMLTACAMLTNEPPEPAASPTPQPTPTQGAATIATPSTRTLTLWVAPAFAPNPETPAGVLFANHLSAFESRYSSVNIEVRIKSRTGPGSLLETLTAAVLAAPSTIPDLITLEPYALSEAAARGLLLPLDGSVDIPAEPDWYPYVLPALRFESETIGMPFAGETNILAFRTDLYPSAPRRIETLLAEGHTFQFPAGDPNAEFTLTQYLALEGTLTNTEDETYIDAERLTEVLSFYQAAIEANVLPLTVRQWTDANQTWSEIQSNRTGSAVVPLSLFLLERDPERLGGAPLPTSTESGLALTNTWSWGLVAKDAETDELQIELLIHLMDPEFLGPWTQALGLLPPNGATLAAWTEGPDSALVSSLVTVTKPLPARSSRMIVAAPLFEAVEAVLTEALTPAEAAEAAADAVAAP